MLDQLLNSKTRVKVLSLFFRDERRDYYSQEVIDATSADPANVHRELTKLTTLGVLSVTRKGVRKFYRLNVGSPFHKGLKGLITASGAKRATTPEGWKHLDDGDPWMLAEDIPDIDLFFSQIFLSCFPNEFSAFTGRAYSKVLTVYRGYHLWFFYGDRDSDEVGEHIVRRMLKEPTYAEEVNREIIAEAGKLERFAASLPEEGLSRLSNDQLWRLYRKHDDIHTGYYRWGWIPVAADMFHNNLTNALMGELKKMKVPASRLNEYFATLTQPTSRSPIQQEREEFLEIALAVQKDPLQRKLFKELYAVFEEQDVSGMTLAPHTPQYERLLEKRARSIRSKIRPAILRRIERHYERYSYVKHMWIGKEGVYTFDYYLKELVKLIGRNSDIAGMLDEIAHERAGTLRKKRALMRTLRIAPRAQTLFNAFGDFMVTKIVRRFAQIYAIYRMQPVLEEIARRLKLDLKQVRFMLVSEIEQALTTGLVDRATLTQRGDFCVYYVERGREAVYTGAQAERLAALVQPKEIGPVDTLTGQIGCMGKAQGIVRIISRPSDMVKMEEGDVLVSIATDPDIVPAMKKAAAIVTEQGGVTSHAAIVSRELGIPCVIGTKIATKVLKDGDVVEVDANRGLVKKLR